eukprot:m.107398 g.107398  ORF g.107398 m.107398 type:complete len:67 (+) comp16918_c0_seq3:1110-1310(+)
MDTCMRTIGNGLSCNDATQTQSNACDPHGGLRGMDTSANIDAKDRVHCRELSLQVHENDGYGVCVW